MDKRLRFMRDLIEPMRIAPGTTVTLSRDHDPAATGRVTRPEADDLLRQGTELLAEHQDQLAAQGSRGLLVVLQGLDASGKDGTIKHVMSGVNPQGVAVRSFKEPTREELSHDFLWRYQAALPGGSSRVPNPSATIRVPEVPPCVARIRRTARFGKN